MDVASTKGLALLFQAKAPKASPRSKISALSFSVEFNFLRTEHSRTHGLSLTCSNKALKDREYLD